jgi:hypothetical protein
MNGRVPSQLIHRAGAQAFAALGFIDRTRDTELVKDVSMHKIAVSV